ncbi:hypothetical protein KCU67_g9950, partial [Aureobasidium melanogenum]
LTLYWLGVKIGPGIHAMLINSDWETMAHDAYNDDLEDTLGELVGNSSWLKAVADRVNDNVWKYSKTRSILKL